MIDCCRRNKSIRCAKPFYMFADIKLNSRKADYCIPLCVNCYKQYMRYKSDDGLE